MSTLRVYKPIFTFDERKRPLPVTWDCIFELETHDDRVLPRLITSIKNEWRKEGFVALEINGCKEQYMRVPRDTGSWKVPRRKIWQPVSTFASDFEEVAFSVKECSFYEEMRRIRNEGLLL